MPKTGSLVPVTFILVIIFFSSGCASLEKLMFEEEMKGVTVREDNNQYNLLFYKNEAIKKIHQTAKFEFYNENIFLDIQGSIGTIFSFIGYIVDQPHLEPKGLSYQVTNNRSRGEIIDFIIKLSHPLPVSKSISDNTRLIGHGSHIRGFGIVRGFEEVISFNGVSRKLPIVEMKLIYDVDDRTYRFPLWICDSLKK